MKGKCVLCSVYFCRPLVFARMVVGLRGIVFRLVLFLKGSCLTLHRLKKPVVFPSVVSWMIIQVDLAPKFSGTNDGWVD